MPTETPEENATSTQAKTKQERIRDNQRRSRARRQEYLADLERRLSECQITCREADIQRAALLELQIENAKLRELLSLAGVNEQFIEHYVSQAVAQSGQFPQESGPAFRQLKPKIAPVDIPRSLNSFATTSMRQIAPGGTPIMTSPSSASMPEMSMAEASVMPTASTSYMPASSYTLAPTPELPAPPSFDWVYQQSPSMRSQESAEEWCCNTFGVPARGPVRVADENAILCSVAKQMIDQYHLSPAEMDEVKAKLAEGFCRPQFPGGGCAVNNQTLFQVLNELSGRYPR